MLQIDDTVVSLDLIEKKFVCDLNSCCGACCVHGDSGGPVSEEEINILEDIIDEVKPFMTAEGIAQVQKEGVFVVDIEGDLVTPTLDGKDCAYAYKDAGITKCSIEKAYLEGKVKFRKPISCYLYPVRLKQYDGFIAVNYDSWEICKPACVLGEKEGIPVYQFLKEPLIAKFGNNWYEQLHYAAEHYDKDKS